jgi:transposase
MCSRPSVYSQASGLLKPVLGTGPMRQFHRNLICGGSVGRRPMVDLPHGTVMPPSVCWPVPTWSSSVKRRSGKSARKRGRRPPPDPAHGAGGAAAGPRPGRSRGAAVLPARVVAMAPGPPGSRRSLPRRAARAPPGDRTIRPRRPAARNRRGGVDRRRVVPDPTAAPAPEAHDRAAAPRPPDGAAGILWVVRSDASWRAMPTEYGTWETAYQRYRLWCATGLWPRILAALPQAESKVSL